MTSKKASRWTVLLVSLFVVAGAVSCGGGRGGGGEDDGKVRDVQGVVDDIEEALNAAYEAMGRPEPNLETMREVQTATAETLHELQAIWPGGTSYLLNAMEDRITIRVEQRGNTQTREWTP